MARGAGRIGDLDDPRVWHVTVFDKFITDAPKPKKQNRASLSDLEAYRLERLAEILSPVEREAFWGGVVAALKAADGLDEGHTVDLLNYCKKKVRS